MRISKFPLLLLLLFIAILLIYSRSCNTLFNYNTIETDKGPNDYNKLLITNNSSYVIDDIIIEAYENWTRTNSKKKKRITRSNTDVLNELKKLETNIWAKELQSGGYYNPPKNQTEYSFAIIIPYRDRVSHLVKFLETMHPYFQSKKAEYQIFVVEQDNDNIFNKGALMNAGYDYISRIRNNNFDCYVFHDVDVLPLIPNVDYHCSKYPFHIGSYVNVFNYRLAWNIVGAVFSVTQCHFTKLNGFSNLFEGWGGEDDDMYRRVIGVYKHLDRPLEHQRFYMIKHNRDNKNPIIPIKMRWKLLDEALLRYKNDGVNTIKYSTTKVTRYKLLTWIKLDLPGALYFINETNYKLMNV